MAEDVQKTEQLDDQTIVVATNDSVHCELEGESIILSMKDGVYYGLNLVGHSIWQLIQEPRSIADVVARLLEEYDVEPEQCRQDLIELLRDLHKNGLVEFRQ